MAVRQYIGARYVPLFMGEWDNTQAYEPLTVVEYQGNSYTSRQAVPTGIAITNEQYWVQTGNYSAQIEAYRQEVQAYNNRIATLEGKFPVETSDIADEAVTANKIAANSISSSKIVDGGIGFIDLNSNIQQRIMNKNIRFSHFVFIGDSYGRGVGGTDGQGWPYYVVQRLGISEGNYINVSNSGAGFIATGNSAGLEGLTFSGQLNYAAENLPGTLETIDIDYVIIAGGYNDHAQSGISAAVYKTVNNARSLFPNAKVMSFPLCVGDRTLDASYNFAYCSIINGTTRAGGAASTNSLYWLYPNQIETSYGDNIHPNDTGYQMLGRNIATEILGGNVLAYTSTFGASAEGYSVADGASVAGGFRCGVTNAQAWFSGNVSKTGNGELLTLPSYCRPNHTVYFLAFAYADSTHHGVMRMRVFNDGRISALALESGEWDSSLNWTYYFPMHVMPLGHQWQ